MQGAILIQSNLSALQINRKIDEYGEAIKLVKLFVIEKQQNILKLDFTVNMRAYQREMTPLGTVTEIMKFGQYLLKNEITVL